MAISLTRKVGWANYERAILGNRSMAAISWMFRRSNIPWEKLLVISTTVMINRFGINGGTLAIDETDKKRSKSSMKIYKLHKIKDKADRLLRYRVNKGLVKELARFELLRVVFLDTGFVSDAIKINVEQIFKQMSPHTKIKAI